MGGKNFRKILGGTSTRLESSNRIISSKARVTLIRNLGEKLHKIRPNNKCCGVLRYHTYVLCYEKWQVDR